MPVCICGFAKTPGVCDGTHRTVKAVRESIAQQIESDSDIDNELKERLAGIIRKSKRGY